MRSSFEVDGTGVTVGVISDGIAGLQSAVSSGDLPPTTLSRDGTGKLMSTSGGIIATSFRGDGDLETGLNGSVGAEGTAILEIVHDIAPGAQLRFANFLTELDFIAAVDFLAANSDVVIDDIGFAGVPYDQTSSVSSNTALELNRPSNRIRGYYTSVGNQALQHYEETFVSDGVCRTDDSTCHQFSTTGDTTDAYGLSPSRVNPVFVAAGQTVVVFLTWDDAFGATTSDYDLYLIEEVTSNVVAVGGDDNPAVTREPVEFVAFTNLTGSAGWYDIEIVNFLGTQPVHTLELFVFGTQALPNGTRVNFNTLRSSVPGQSDAGGGALSVGAVWASDPGLDTIESYSSRGPTNNGAVKPDVVAVDGVSVTGAGGFPSTFFGTSAAAPHVAGLAALLLGELVLITIVLLIPRVTSAVSYPFVDDAESLGSWVADPPWGRTTDDSHSATHSWTDSPSAYYANNTSLTLVSAVDLSTSTSPQLSFWHHYSLEAGFDFGYVEVATSSSSGPWDRIATYSGAVTLPYSAAATAAKANGAPATNAFPSTPGEPWVLEQLSLVGYVDQPTVWVRFRLVTDGSGLDDGWYVDDVAIAELPAAVTLSPTVTSTQSTLELSWSANADADFGGYKVFRSESSGVTFNDTLVATVASQATTTFKDTGLPSKTKFYYSVFTVNTSGVYNGSNEVSGTTLAGLDYPFSDDMEVSGGNWTPQPSTAWTRLTVADAHSGSNVSTDSPGGNYANNVDVSLVLSDSLPVSPRSTLVFWHKLAVLTGDTASVEVSTDSGTTWGSVASYTGTTVADWTRVQAGLGLTTTTSAIIRFRLTSDASGVDDGWTIDDVSVSDLPDPVTLNAPVPQGALNQDKMLLTWSTSTVVGFAAYEIYRGAVPGVTEASTRVATITQKSTTSYTDSGLTPGVTFYYRVYVLNDFGVRSASNEASATTLLIGVVPYPFFDDMESGAGAWEAGGTWAHTTAFAYSTTTSWTDSPNTNYPDNTDASLQLSITLAGAQMPELVFWQRYSFEQNVDFGYVEVSINAGATWNRVYFVTGASPDFVKERVDFTEYAGSPDVSIRFRLVSGASGPSDGWYIDDVSIAETAGPAIPYPFFDDLESSTDRWITGSWGVTGPAHSGTEALTDSPVLNSKYPENTNSHMRLVLASTIDLLAATNPQLTFWHRHFFVDGGCTWNYEIDRGRVYVSDFFGQTQTWQQVASFRGTQSLWTQHQIDLSAYAGFSKVRVMFAITDDSGCYADSPGYFNEADGWYIDDVRIEEAPVDVTLNALANVTMHGADLSWSQNTEADFNRYEVYRAKNVDPTLAGTLVATITNQTTTSTHST